MKLDLRPLVNGEKDIIEFDFSEQPEEDSLSDITFRNGIKATGRITDFSGYMRLELDVSGKYRTSCARCLKELERDLFAHIEKDVALKEMLQDKESEDYLICEGTELDLGEVIDEVLYLELPTRLLCSDDCKGLCPKCGKNLNEGSCDCNLHEPDPRWAALKNYFSENK